MHYIIVFVHDIFKVVNQIVKGFMAGVFLEIFIRDRHNGGVLPLAGMYLISGYFFDESADQFKKEYLYLFVNCLI